MGSNWKIFIAILAGISIIGLFGVYLIGKNKPEESLNNSNISETGEVAGTTTQNDDYVKKLAVYLSQRGMVLYGSFQSEDTKAQKDLFLDAQKFLNYVECDASGENANPDECIGQKIEVYPTWVYQGQKYKGLQSLADLAKITNFTE